MLTTLIQFMDRFTSLIWETVLVMIIWGIIITIFIDFEKNIENFYKQIIKGLVIAWFFITIATYILQYSLTL